MLRDCLEIKTEIEELFKFYWIKSLFTKREHWLIFSSNKKTCFLKWALYFDDFELMVLQDLQKLTREYLVIVYCTQIIFIQMYKSPDHFAYPILFVSVSLSYALQLCVYSFVLGLCLYHSSVCMEIFILTLTHHALSNLLLKET